MIADELGRSMVWPLESLSVTLIIFGSFNYFARIVLMTSLNVLSESFSKFRNAFKNVNKQKVLLPKIIQFSKVI